MIVIVDYGVGNILSVKVAFQKLAKEVILSSERHDIKRADMIVLPGVGSFGEAIKNIEKFRLREILKEKAEKGTPFLGICLGMQILFEESEESSGIEGVGLIEGSVSRFPSTVKIPHLGWNRVFTQDEELLINGSYFYFAHSFYCIPKNYRIIFGETLYGIKFPSIIKKENILGVQFHPEKSGEKGMEFLRRWLHAYNTSH